MPPALWPLPLLIELPRRHVLAGLGAASLLANVAARAQSSEQAAIEARYGLSILTADLQATVAAEVTRPDRPVQMTDLPARNLPAALASLRAALAVYPDGFVRQMLHRVALAGDITVYGQPAGGLFHRDMVAISDFNVDDPASASFDSDTLHHELSSIVRAHATFNVTAWEAANPPGFQYLDLAAYKKVLADPGSVDGTDALHRQGFVARYGMTSLDNDWNTYAEKVFGHGRDFSREIRRFPAMQAKTRLLIDIYLSFDQGFGPYFQQTGLASAAP